MFARQPVCYETGAKRQRQSPWLRSFLPDCLHQLLSIVLQAAAVRFKTHRLVTALPLQAEESGHGH
ncbi:MAG: hypothetical protein PVG66_06575 [Chromatiales bacterium]|jgi:hypothetical protein